MGLQCSTGDRCEQLCASVSFRLQTCKPDSLTWFDLGAEDRQDFVDACRDQWNRERLDLSASDLAVALDFCRDAADEVLSCEEVVALYGPSP